MAKRTNNPFGSEAVTVDTTAALCPSPGIQALQEALRRKYFMGWTAYRSAVLPPGRAVRKTGKP